jgi:hypothetical protein
LSKSRSGRRDPKLLIHSLEIRSIKNSSLLKTLSKSRKLTRNSSGMSCKEKLDSSKQSFLFNFRTGGKLRVKNSQYGKHRGSSLENLGLREPYYHIQFTPSEFILVLLCVIFRVVRFELY